MPILAQPNHIYKDGDIFVAAKVDLGNLVIAQTRNEEHASEGYFGNVVTVIPMQEAIAIAKAVLATQEADEDAAYEAWIEVQYQRHLDFQALADSALHHEISF